VGAVQLNSIDELAELFGFDDTYKQSYPDVVIGGHCLTSDRKLPKGFLVRVLFRAE